MKAVPSAIRPVLVTVEMSPTFTTPRNAGPSRLPSLTRLPRLPLAATPSAPLTDPVDVMVRSPAVQATVAVKPVDTVVLIAPPSGTPGLLLPGPGRITIAGESRTGNAGVGQE